jgi:hypothetical protein
MREFGVLAERKTMGKLTKTACVIGLASWGMAAFGQPGTNEIWYSTEIGFTSGGGPAAFPVSDGDLLSDQDCLVAKHRHLTARLGIMPPAPDLGLDGVTQPPCASESEFGSEQAACSQIWFSLEQSVFSETLGWIRHGDLVSDAGHIVAREEDLLREFRPQGTSIVGFGLDAIHSTNFSTPSDRPVFLFSTETNFFSQALGRNVNHGDLLDSRGSIYRTNAELMRNFRPTQLRDFGLDGVYLVSEEEIWFTIEVGFIDGVLGSISDGDLLSDRGVVIRRNLDIVQACGPIEDLHNFGLDGVHVGKIVPVDGACCLPDGTCLDGQTQDTCEAQCGDFAGAGTSCEEIGGCPELPTGACCLPTDECVETHGACLCESEGGVYEGDGTVCELTLCGACEIDRFQELMIIHTDVVDDAVRTTCRGPSPADCGPWTFGALAAAVAGTDDRRAVSEFVLDLFRHFDEDQNINGFRVARRPLVDDLLIQPWITASGGELLDFSIAPFRLQAIVNRPDLRNGDPALEAIKAGEGRFVFGGLPGGNFTDFFTIIFEFKLPGDTFEDVKRWQMQWHALNTEFNDFGPGYRAALQAITDQFATIGADPTSPNGSALGQFRSNEFFRPTPAWELREWRLLCPGDSECPEGGEGQCTDTGVLLTETTVEQTPDLTLNNTQRLADYMLEFADDIRSGLYRVPCEYQGSGQFPVSFRAGSSLVTVAFNPPGGSGVPQDVRDIFAINTCSGCHQVEFPATPFQHVNERQAGQPASLSAFLNSPGPDNDDLDRRETDLCDNVLTVPVILRGASLDAEPVPPRPPHMKGRPH